MSNTFKLDKSQVDNILSNVSKNRNFILTEAEELRKNIFQIDTWEGFANEEYKDRVLKLEEAINKNIESIKNLEGTISASYDLLVDNYQRQSSDIKGLYTDM